jgi:Ca2+-binding EF-hand superfamily protein/ankyrin repeat protein
MSNIETEYHEKINEWVYEITRNPKNLASETELFEQGRMALKYFLQYDTDRSQTISFDELKLLCDHLGLPVEDDEEEMLRKLDKDGNGTLDLHEFISWWLKRISSLPNPAKQQEAIAKYTFSQYDADKSGFLDRSELKNLVEALGASFTDDEIDQAVKEIDSDNSGVIESSEFICWWTNRIVNKRSSTSLIALKLKKLAAKANQVFHTDIFRACWDGNQDLITAFAESEPRLLKATDDSSDFSDGWSPLHYLCYRGYDKIVSSLFSNYLSALNINATTNNGFTPLFYAAQQGHLDICELLLDHNADPTLFGTVVPSVDSEETSLTNNTPSSFSSTPTPIFMAPVEFILDYPELKSLFLKHPKCQNPPKTLSSSQYSLSVRNSNNILFSLTLTVNCSLKSISSLPIKSWKYRLSWKNSSSFLKNDIVNHNRLLESAASKNFMKEYIFSFPSAHPTLNQPNSSSSNNSTWIQNNIPLSNHEFLSFLQFYYYCQLLESFTVDFNTSTLATAQTLSCDYFLLVFKFYSKIMNLLLTNLSSIVKLGGFQHNYHNNVEELFLSIIERLVSSLNKNSANEGSKYFLPSLENLKLIVQQLFDEKHQQMEKKKELLLQAETIAAAAENKKNAKREESKGGDTSNREKEKETSKSISMYLAFEEMEQCIMKGIDQIQKQSPSVPSVAPTKTGKGTGKGEDKKGFAGGDEGSTSRNSESGKTKKKEQVFSIRSNIPDIELSASIGCSNILYESVFSEPINIAFAFPL